MEYWINLNSTILYDGEDAAILWAVRTLERDILKTCRTVTVPGISVRLSCEVLPAECFELRIEAGELAVKASDRLGFVYGLLEISRSILGVHEFWFWNDQQFHQSEGFVLEDGFYYSSKPFSIRYRGWFINDEVLLHKWQIDRREAGPWEMAFEALLRCGGNMVVPGTDKNSKKYAPLAAKMGLSITHHHAEPLGAEMFARAYPELRPSYVEHPDLFRKLWKEGITCQKSYCVLWNLGFRGQGDYPFWENDPGYATPEARGKLIGDLIRIQYDMVRQEDPKAVTCTNLYGETLELYRDGYLTLPEDTIRIWADNGYGRMVSRRQWNYNPRIPSLPVQGKGKNGLYYHVSFFDLQAANHMTMLPNRPEFVRSELISAIQHGVSDYWIINCSNIKPHIYYLDFIAQLWQEGDIDVAAHQVSYLRKYYGGDIRLCLNHYFDAAVSFGPHEDEKAGEQFANYIARVLICQYMKDPAQRSEELLWAADVEKLAEQISWYSALCRKAAENYGRHLQLCRKTADTPGLNRTLFEDSFLLQAKMLACCYQGATLVCEALQHACRKDWQAAFFLAGKARKQYLMADTAMRAREHGKWTGFYINECLTDIKQTAWVLESLMGWLRCVGDGPYYYAWQREFLYSEEDRRVMLVMNMENHLKDLELFSLMEAKIDG